MQLWGIVGAQVEVVLASARTIVTVEEVVDELDVRPFGRVIPSMKVDAVCHVPGGAHPSYALGYYERDNDAYLAWDDISSDRARFLEWIESEVLVSH